MKKWEAIREFLIITFATVIVAAAVFFFLIPSHVSVGSISGLAIVLGNFIPLKISAITLVLNIFLLILGFLFIGREFGAKTVYTSLLLPVMLGVFELLFPNNQSITNDAFLDMLCYIFVVSIGLAMLFNRNASSGGLDIVAKFLNKYFHMDLGKAMSLAGMCVALSSALVYDKKILHHLHSGATIYEAIGAYDNQPKKEIITIVDKNEYAMLMSYIMKTDKNAFVTVYTVNEIIYRPKR